jgi:outer membrane protein TolC
MPPTLPCLRRLPLCLLLLVGCAQLDQPESRVILLPPVISRGASQEPTHLPEKARPGPELGFSDTLPSKALPINLDTVLRLAQDQNGQIAIGREKLNEAFAGLDVAARAWLPDLWVGTTFYRHEGGIQNEDGTLTHSSFGALFAGLELHGRFDVREAVYQKIDAERKIWQQRGELSKLTSEALLDASSTYVDLLAARAGEAIALKLEGYLQELLKEAERIAKVDPGLEVEVFRVKSEISAQKQILRKLREGARSASAKLLYLLGLDPNAELVVMDRQLVAFYLVDASVPAAALVDQALTSGPGVRELEGLLNLIHSSQERARGLGQYLPVFDVRVGQGGFGAGPGDALTWDNRLDVVLQARWNVTNLLTARDRQRVASAKIQQAHLSYNDLRAKLTLGVQEAYEAINSNREQMDLGERQVREATAAYDKSKLRLEKKIKGYSPSEVLLAIRSLAGAQLGYLSAIREHDKAQLRLLVLTGMVGDSERRHCR